MKTIKVIFAMLCLFCIEALTRFCNLRVAFYATDPNVQEKLIPSFSRASAIMNTFKNIHTSAGGDLASFRSTPSYLRQDAVLGSSSNISFDFTPNAATLKICHILRPQDVFMPYMWRLSIRKASGTTQSDAADAVSYLYTEPNPAVFTGSNEAINLYSVFNCFMQTQMGSTNVDEFIRTNDFYTVGVAEYGLYVSQLATPLTPNSYGSDQKSDPDWGFIDYHADRAFNGKLAPLIQLYPVGGLNLGGTSSTNYASIEFKGVLFQNASDAIQDAVIKNFSSGIKMGG